MSPWSFVQNRKLIVLRSAFFALSFLGLVGAFGSLFPAVWFHWSNRATGWVFGMGVAVYFVSAVAYRTIKRPEVPHSPPTGTSIEPCPTCRGHGKVEYTSFGRLVWEARGPWWWPPARVWGWWPDESAPECRMYKPVEDSV